MPLENKTGIAHRLKLARKELGMTQKNFGEPIELPQNTVKNLEAGITKVTVELAILIERVHGINLRWLLTGEGEMFLSQEKTNNEAPTDEATSEVARLMANMDEQGKQTVLHTARQAERIVRLEKKLAG